MGSVIEVRNLTIHATQAGQEVPIVQDISFSVQPGQVLALIGESGSGKTTIALALMAYAREGCRIAGGSIRIDGQEILGQSAQVTRKLRGGKIAYVAQSAAASFNPSRRIIDQVIEPTVIHHGCDLATARSRVLALFRELALPDPDNIGDRYPHQVSGGQLQRMMAAMALINNPDVVIFDEPTTSLDVTTQIEVLRAFRHAIRERKTTAIYVSHDLAVVAQMADEILVLRHGQMQELSPTEQLIEHPQHPYTVDLLNARKPRDLHSHFVLNQASNQVLLELRNIDAGYGKKGKDHSPVKKILHDINFKIYRGQAIGVIGESGSGKTTLAGVVAGLVAPTRGEVLFKEVELAPLLSNRNQDHLRRVQMVFQMADTALNPRLSIEQILARPLVYFHGLGGQQLEKRIVELLDLVKLPASIMKRVPRALSGGQKQRINLARALAAEPDLILCDEVTSALDTVVGAAILDLIVELRKELGVSFLFISHDLNTVRSVCDEIIVMKQGRIVTRVERANYYACEQHPYYKQLMTSVPELCRDWLTKASKSSI